jgi:SAM-dependent methyltransferase
MSSDGSDSGGVAPTARFSDRAAAYAAYRPSYSREAIDAVLAGLGDPKLLSLADIGAGTGISARSFADRGVRVTAVEPNADMRHAAAAHPRVTWQDGTGEATGLPDGAVDIVAACQSFHWFATQAALNEFRRIARRRAVLVQYERNERDPFSKDYGDVVRAHATDETEALRMYALGVFGRFPGATVNRHAFTSEQSLDLDGLLGRASSASYLANSGPEAVSLRRDLRSIFENHERAGRVTLSIVTFVLIADW